MICTITINPAIDKLLFINEFNPDNTNRIKRIEKVLGGKGTHVSINLSILGCENRAYGIGFGETGKEIVHILEERENIDMKILQYEEGNSRTNYALIEESGKCSLITEKGHMISEQICQKFLDLLQEDIESGDTLVLSGDASNTEIPHIYNRIIDLFQEKNVKIILDTSSENLKYGLERHPFLVKPNEDELSQVTGRVIKSDEDVLNGLDLLKQYRIPCIVISRGSKGTIARYKGVTYKVEPLQVNVQNTIGCGDALLSGLVYGLEKQMGFVETLKYATGVAAATAESELTVGFDLDRALALKEQVVVKEVH